MVNKKIMIKAFIIIPAKGDSKRLVGKNKKIIAGKTLLEHSIIYAQESNIPGTIIISTEDEETKAIAESYGVTVVGREKNFMGEREVADVYIKIFQEYGDESFTHVVGVQPDHPDRTLPLDGMLEYFIKNKYDDLFTVDPDGTRNGSIRITKSEHVRSGYMSRRVGSMADNCTNIHNDKDLLNAEKNIYERLH
jgi:N-acylneuraminate cytidylyltransferase|tara:strand:+ start:3152 stop:3730 length:579 start_codon:yes stop_codon:yes gene_type:complete